MDPHIVAAIAASLLAAVGVVGIVIPVLPGSLTIGVGLLVWALWGGSPWGWLTFAAGVLFVAAGMSASWVLTGRTLTKREIPQWPVLVGLAVGVVGLFVLPGLGFLIGFVLGVFASEFARLRQVKQAAETSWRLILAVGKGMLVELGCGVVAAGILGVGILTTFAS